MRAREPRGIGELARDFELELLPSPSPGHQEGELLFPWPKDRSRRFVFRWEVTPSVAAAPSGIVVKRSACDTPVEIVVTSFDRPVRIVGVEGPLAKPFVPTTEAKQTHRLSLILDSAAFRRHAVRDLIVTTNHPDQPMVSVVVLQTTENEGGGP